MGIGKAAARRMARDLMRAINFFLRSGRNLRRLGTDYGGWKVPASLLCHGNVAMCVGAGEDISFDVELNKAGLRVITVDPTPRAIAHVQGVMSAAAQGARYAINRSNSDSYDFDGFELDRFAFAPFGAWSHATTLKFYAPRDPDHVSHSVLNLQESETYFEAQCDKISALMSRYGVDELSILKLDVEGAEYVVIDDLIESNVLPRCLLIEFDELHSPKGVAFAMRFFRTLCKLKKAGYKLVDVEAANFSLLKAEM